MYIFYNFFKSSFTFSFRNSCALNGRQSRLSLNFFFFVIFFIIIFFLLKIILSLFSTSYYEKIMSVSVLVYKAPLDVYTHPSFSCLFFFPQEYSIQVWILFGFVISKKSSGNSELLINPPFWLVEQKSEDVVVARLQWR